MKTGAALIGWSALTALFGSAILISYASHHSNSAPTPTIGEVCPQTLVSGDETYLRNNLTCVEMHKVADEGDMYHWTVVYIVGTETSAVFQREFDAEAWARSQPYVRRKDQVR